MSAILHILLQHSRKPLIKQKKARRDVLPTRRANYAHRRKRGVQRKNNNTARAFGCTFSYRQRENALDTVSVEQGEWNRKRRATVRLQLTSFDYGSIFLSPPRRYCFNFANGRCERQGQSLLRVQVRSHKLDATATVNTIQNLK